MKLSVTLEVLERFRVLGSFAEFLYQASIRLWSLCVGAYRKGFTHVNIEMLFVFLVQRMLSRSLNNN